MVHFRAQNPLMIQSLAQAMFPDGLPSVDPNQPLQSQRRLQEAVGRAGARGDGSHGWLEFAG